MRGSPRPPNAGKGRPKGAVNKITAEVRAAAQVYTKEALTTLVRLMRGQNCKGQGTLRGAASDAVLRGAGDPQPWLRPAGDGGDRRRRDRAGAGQHHLRRRVLP